MRKSISIFAILLGLSTAASAAEFKGFIMDEKCSTNAKMRGDADCAAKCIKGGSPAVLVTSEGKVYKIADQAKVTPMAGKNVTITGEEKGGTITVASIK